MKIQSVLRNRMPIACLESLPNPARPMHITQSARSFLDVRLELIDRIPEFLVAKRLHVGEDFQKAISVLFDQPRHDLAIEFESGSGVADEKSGIEEGRV